MSEGHLKRAYIIHLLFELGFGFGQGVDFVLLCLQVIQGLLVGLLEGLLLLGQLGDGLVQACHLLREVFHLRRQACFALNVGS